MPRREEERYDDRPARRRDEPPAEDGGKTAVKVLGILGGVVVCVVLVCGGVAAYVFYSIKKGVNAVKQDLDGMAQQAAAEQARLEKQRAEKAADRRKAREFANLFLDDAKAGRAAEAYAVTSRAYQQRVTAPQLSALCRDQEKALRAVRAFPEGFPMHHELDPPYRYSSTGVVQGQGIVKVELTVIKEDGAWKVQSFTAGPN